MYNLFGGVIVLFVAWSSVTRAAQSLACPQPIEHTDSVDRFVCNSRGQVIEKQNLFKKTMTPSRIDRLDNGRLVERQIFDIGYNRTALFYFSYPDESHFIKEQVDLVTNVVSFRAKYTGAPDGDSNKRVMEWRLDDQTGEVKEVDSFKGDDQQRPYRRDVFISRYGLPPARYYFEYLHKETSYASLREVTVTDLDDQLIGKYSTQQSNEAIQEALLQTTNKTPKALIIDTGFYWMHPWLVDKIYINSNEKLDGFDNDGDGFIDNITTIYRDYDSQGKGIYRFNVGDSMILDPSGEPIAHGTHVASVAMQDINEHSFIGAGGNMADPVHLKNLIPIVKKHDLRFTNMSFALGDERWPFAPSADGYQALYDLIAQTPNTLHFLAAANDGTNFDESDKDEFPACWLFANTMTVGALTSATIDEPQLHLSSVADFSNVGSRCVDVMAPGEAVLGAGIGHNSIRISGTSMASPYAMNLAYKIYELVPGLSAQDYKKLVLATVFVPQTVPYPVRSGGAIFPYRALRAAEYIQGGLSVDQAIMQARADIIHENEMTDIAELQAMWTDRGLDMKVMPSSNDLETQHAQVSRPSVR